MASVTHQPQHPFFTHLVALLSVYELGPSLPTLIPKYEGPTDWQIESILHSLGAISHRMYTAEENLSSIRAEKGCGLESKKRQSGSDHPPGSSASPFFTPISSVESIPDILKDVDTSDRSRVSTSEPTSHSAPGLRANGRKPNGMTINLDGVVNPLDKIRRTAGSSITNVSPAPPSVQADDVACPGCGRIVTDTETISKIVKMSTGGTVTSPLVVNPGPPSAAALENGMSVADELKLLKTQVHDVSRVCNAVARGDLSQKITVPVQGVVMIQLKDVINAMVDKLGQFAKEVTRVSQEVGTEGKLGSQALVLEVEGTWRELTGEVNTLATNLTAQLRSITEVSKAVALGDLTQLIDCDARGEVLELKNAINGLVFRLRAAQGLTKVRVEVDSE